MAAPCIVSDLIPLILDMGNFWPRDLVSLALVSANWLFHTRHALYSTPSLCSYKACSLFAQTLRDNEPLRYLAHGIVLSPSHNVQRERESLVSNGVADIRFILATLDQLTHVTLGSDLAVGAQQYLHILPNPEHVSSLTIMGRPFYDEVPNWTDATLEWDESLSIKFSGLQSLRLTSLELEVVAPLPRLAVSSVSVEHVSLLDGSLSDLFASHTLKTVSVTSDGMPGGLEEQLRLVLESLHIEELHYSAENCTHDRAFAFLSPSIPIASVQRLFIMGTHICAPMTRLIGQSFPSLRELSISGRATFTTAEEWVTLLQNSSFPSLQALSIPAGTCYPPYRVWGSASDTIIQEGQRRGIAVSLREPNRTGSVPCFLLVCS